MSAETHEALERLFKAAYLGHQGTEDANGWKHNPGCSLCRDHAVVRAELARMEETLEVLQRVYDEPYESDMWWKAAGRVLALFREPAARERT